MTSKLEVNIRSLISHCEELAKEDPKTWRLNKYIGSLDTMIKELESSENKPNVSIMDEYYVRCNKLKKSIDYVESAPLSRKLKLKTVDDGSQDAVIKEIKQIHKSNYNTVLRTELLGSDKNDDAFGLRKRASGTGSNSNGDDMGQTIKYYGDMQERISENILSLTRNLKEQTETANKIIRKDTEIVSTSTNLSDRNVSSLTKEAEKLEDHSKRAWKCWMWLMIGLVMVIFIFMVMFMKIMKKKTS